MRNRNFRIVKSVDPAWSDYDKLVAWCHLENYGFIIVDPAYDEPIDDEYETEKVFRQVTGEKEGV